MAFKIKALLGGGIQIEDDAEHWIIFSRRELRCHAIELNGEMVEGEPRLSADKAIVFVWAALAAARGYAIEHGLIEWTGG